MSLLYVSLGANIGDREGTLRRAVCEMEHRIGPCVALSRMYETAPVGFDSPHAFLNAAAAFRVDFERLGEKAGGQVEEADGGPTVAAALCVLEITQEIECELGRLHKSVGGKYADRPIDIDLLLWGDLQMEQPELTLPHPHLHKRHFVLDPLAEIAPDLLHPTLGQSIQTIQRNNSPSKP